MRAVRNETENSGANTTAPYSKDEVSGPLKGVGKEEVLVVERHTVALDGEGANRTLEESKKNEIKVTRGAKVSVNIFLSSWN